MHHALAFVRLPRRQELVTDPAQILRLLLCQWNARLNACMDEGIIADLDHVLETIQKIHMDSGYVIEQPIRQFRSDEQTSELPSLLRISYAIFCLKKNTT